MHEKLTVECLDRRSFDSPLPDFEGMCTFNHAIVAFDGEDNDSHNLRDYDSHNFPDYNNPNIIANGTAFHLNACT